MGRNRQSNRSAQAAALDAAEKPETKAPPPGTVNKAPAMGSPPSVFSRGPTPNPTPRQKLCDKLSLNSPTEDELVEAALAHIDDLEQRLAR